MGLKAHKYTSFFLCLGKKKNQPKVLNKALPLLCSPTGLFSSASRRVSSLRLVLRCVGRGSLLALPSQARSDKGTMSKLQVLMFVLPVASTAEKRITSFPSRHCSCKGEAFSHSAPSVCKWEHLPELSSTFPRVRVQWLFLASPSSSTRT